MYEILTVNIVDAKVLINNNLSPLFKVLAGLHLLHKTHWICIVDLFFFLKMLSIGILLCFCLCFGL